MYTFCIPQRGLGEQWSGVMQPFLSYSLSAGIVCVLTMFCRTFTVEETQVLSYLLGPLHHLLTLPVEAELAEHVGTLP